ncbi:MAG: carboxylesterase/lipase family protein [Ilumatobacter sp.]
MTRLEGIDRGSSVEFRGLRYARAERMEPPDDVERVETDAGGAAFGAQAPQLGGILEQLLGAGDLEMSEDCLFLNVFTPAADDGRRPVLVFVHGGAFVTGTGAMAWYDGAAMAERGDVVVVTINYRLGVFGFFDDLNLGTRDQISALRWIRRHIGDFGGDPGQVTVFGESAGGSSVVSLMAAPSADELFHRAWAMSPSLTQFRDRDTALDLADRYLASLDQDRSGLRSASMRDLLDGQQRFLGTVGGMQHFSPTDGSAVFPTSIIDVAASDTRPLVLGTNRDEMQLYTAFDGSRAAWGDDEAARQFRHRFGARADEAIEAYSRARPNHDANRLVAAMQTDEVFRRPAQRLAEARAESAGSTWMYQFEMESTAFGGALGACHGLDLPFAFDTLETHGAEMFTGPGEHRRAVAARLSGAIIEFARSGTAPWVAYELADRATQRIGPVDDIVLDPERDLRILWD